METPFILFKFAYAAKHFSRSDYISEHGQVV